MKKKILVAEDEASIRMVYSIVLSTDYEVIQAENGQEAVDLYKEHRPDLTLMDIRMPVKNGDEAIFEINEFDPQANIIAVTAFRYTEEDLGVPVLRKGFTNQKLLDVVEAGLNGQLGKVL